MRRVVAEFHLATGHDCLRNHLHRLKVVPSAMCPSMQFYKGHELSTSSTLSRFAQVCSVLLKCFWIATDMLD
ncbi:hypothetical protein TNCV_328791 [Trichonephila clavipes]|nr:hypothetical protein TNCV_328791 [Trichonephila clavipes]